jgi:hypothetical protein
MSEMTRLQSRLLLQPGLKSTTGRIFWGFAIAVFALPVAGQGTSSLSAVAWGNGSAIVSWTTPAVASSQVNYGTSSTALTQKVSSSTLTTNHSVTLSGLTAGATYYYSVTSVDSSGKSTTIPATGQAPMNFVATSSIWGPTATPGTASLYDPSAVELGMKFQSDVAGKVAGIRFYKGPNNIGTHVGHLWSSTGTLLASVTFTNETASGWQQAIFATSVSITAKTEYVISYNAPNGYYAEDENFFASATDVPPLHALQSGTSGGNGVYLYGSGSFPNQTWNACNYWVDVVFVPTNTVAPPPTATSIWPATAVPGTVTDPDSSPVELGLKFQSEVAGEITGVRFYKGLKNTGTHQGHLWSASGLLLATANFTNETASGWQQANFSNPVAIQANTIYVISYYAPASHYSADENYFATAGIYNPPLRALQNGTAGSNGVYLYGSSGFPSLSYYATNYWVDVVFTQSAPAATFGISGTVSPASGGAGASLKLSGAATAAVAADSSGSYTFTGLIDGSYTVTPSKVGYTFSPASASVTVNGANVSGMKFTDTSRDP